MSKPEHTNPDYRQWLIDLKTKKTIIKNIPTIHNSAFR